MPKLGKQQVKKPGLEVTRPQGLQGTGVQEESGSAVCGTQQGHP